MIIDEPKENKEFSIAQDTTYIIPNEELVSMSNLTDDIRYLQTTDTVPTNKPTNPLKKFELYINGATKKLYIWDSSTSAWQAITLD